MIKFLVLILRHRGVFFKAIFFFCFKVQGGSHASRREKAGMGWAGKKCRRRLPTKRRGRDGCFEGAFALTNENLGGAVRGLRFTRVLSALRARLWARVGGMGRVGGEGRWAKGTAMVPTDHRRPWAYFLDVGFKCP